MLLPCYMTLFFLGPSISFFILHDSVTMTIVYNVPLITSPKFQNKNKRKTK